MLGRDKVHAQRVPRGRGARGRLRDLHAAGVERAARRARVGAARLVRRADPLPRAGPRCGSRGSASTWPPRSRSTRSTRASSRPGCTRRRAALSGFMLQPVGDGPDDRAGRRQPDGRGRHHPRAPRRATSRYLQRMFEAFEADLKTMYPGLRERLLAPPAPRPRPVLRRDPEARPRRHVPAALARAERRGLYFASETFRSRGIGVDRAARAGLTVGRGLPRPAAGRRFGWRY